MAREAEFRNKTAFAIDSLFLFLLTQLRSCLGELSRDREWKGASSMGCGRGRKDGGGEHSGIGGMREREEGWRGMFCISVHTYIYIKSS